MAAKAKRTERIEAERERQKAERRMKWAMEQDENNMRRLYAGVAHTEEFLKHSVASAMLILLSQAADHYVCDIENFYGIKYRDPKGMKLFREMQSALDKLIDYLDASSKVRFMREGLNREEAGAGVDMVSELGNVFERFGEYLITYCTLSENKWRLERIAKTMDELATPAAKESVLNYLASECRETLGSRYGLGADELDALLAKGTKPNELRLVTKPKTALPMQSNVITPRNIIA